MSETYRVRIAKTEHVFSAAHFITFAGICERLHGHNYHVAVEIEGALDEDHLIVDFIQLRDSLRNICGYLDHYLLLPTAHPQIRVVDDGREVTATFEKRRWIFPSGDCRLLPIPNTTSELLAKHIGGELLAALGEHAARIEHVRVEVDECDGQLGVWQR